MNEMKLALKVVDQLNENYTIKILVEFVTGKASKDMKDFKFDKLELFGSGAAKDELFWHTIFRQAVLNDLLYKEIEQYGILKLTDAGKNLSSIRIHHDTTQSGFHCKRRQ